MGGNVMFQIADGGEFCGLVGCLRAWEKMGDFEVLNQEELHTAMKEGFAWVQDPISCERMEVIEIKLEAFHHKHDRPQRHFPLIYTLRCQLHGGEDDGQEKTVQIPALRQHRDQYGPRPQPLEKPSLLRGDPSKTREKASQD